MTKFDSLDRNTVDMILLIKAFIVFYNFIYVGVNKVELDKFILETISSISAGITNAHSSIPEYGVKVDFSLNVNDDGEVADNRHAEEKQKINFSICIKGESEQKA